MTDALYRECVEFLVNEAEMLDNRQLRGWLELLTPDIDYRVPVRATLERTATSDGFSDTSYHLLEDWGSLNARVARFETEYAWAEDPPSRVRRFISNFRIEPGDQPEEVHVKSNLLLFRSRGDDAPQLISAERRDVLRRVEGQLKLAKRLALLDHSVLPTQNVSFFL